MNCETSCRQLPHCADATWFEVQGKAVLGEDFSMALSGGADADESNLFDRGWKESVAWTGSGGLLLDASVTGGHISLDTEHNEALYSAGVTASQVRFPSHLPVTVVTLTREIPTGAGGAFDVESLPHALSNRSTWPVLPSKPSCFAWLKSDAPSGQPGYTLRSQWAQLYRPEGHATMQHAVLGSLPCSLQESSPSRSRSI